VRHSDAVNSSPVFEGRGDPEFRPAVAGLLTPRSVECPFDPAEELGRLRAEQPLVRVSHPDGTPGWLATSQSTVRAVLADQRFSARPDLMNLPLPDAPPPGQMPPAQPGMFPDMDPPDHTRYRRRLIGWFTVRRVREFTTRVEQIIADHLDAMSRHGGPLDLVTAYAQPIPALMICELLGVPYTEREQFQEHAVLLTKDH
jgi:cytochrome P450